MNPKDLPSTGRLARQAVAAPVGNENFRVRGIALDLLTQAVDVGLQGVGRDLGVIAPHLVERKAN